MDIQVGDLVVRRGWRSEHRGYLVKYIDQNRMWLELPSGNLHEYATVSPQEWTVLNRRARQKFKSGFAAFVSSNSIARSDK